MRTHLFKEKVQRIASFAVTVTVVATSLTVVNSPKAKLISDVSSVNVLAESAEKNIKDAKTARDISVKTVKNKKLTITYIDVRQGDSTFIELPNKKAMLIDAGESYSVDSVIDFIKDKEYKKIDYVIATHPHADHIGGMEKVVRTFKIGKIFMPSEKTTSQTYKKMMAAIKAKGLTVKQAFAGMKILNKKKMGLKGTLLAPQKDKSYSDTNDYSIVFKLKYKKNKFLFTGDAESLSEGEMIDAGYNLSADVLKVGHHGSLSSTSASFLAEVSPKLAVISVGEGNKYKHPEHDTLKRLKTFGTKILRTDKNGNITVVSTGRKITYSTSKKKNSMNLKAQSKIVASDPTNEVQLAFSHKGGWYKDSFDLTLASNHSKAKIYYTTDGSEPDYDTNYSTQRYNDETKITIYDATEDTNVYSAESYVWYKAHPYTPAKGLQPKCITVKAYAVYGGKRTKTITENYFVDPELHNKYGVKVISLTGDPVLFFNNAEENAGLMREEWRRSTDSALGHVQIFDENGKEIINQNVNVKLHGSYSKMFNQKSFRLHADEQYDSDNNKFVFPLFDDLKDINGEPITTFKRIIARNGGNDCTSTMLRDSLNSRLASELGIGVMASEPAVIYHCGEFYGVCNIRERLDDHYIKEHYNIAREDVVMITATDSFELNEGVPGVDDKAWKDFVAFVNGNDMSKDTNYAKFEEQVDVDNYIKYITSELFVANTDWVVNNVRVWKSKGVATAADKDTTDDNGVNYNDGKWRFLMYDTDLSGGVFHPDGEYGDNPTDFEFDSLKYMQQFSLTGTEIDLFNLLENAKFREKFINTYVNIIHTTFAPARINAVLDELTAEIEKAMPYEINRFGYLTDMNDWKSNLQAIKDFYEHRGGAILRQLDAKWGLEGVEIPTAPPMSSPTATPNASATVSPYVTMKPTTERVTKICQIKYNGKVKSIIKGGTFAKPAEPKKIGNTFIRWYKNKNFTKAVKFPLIVNKDIQLYAKFEKNPPAVKAKSIKIVSSGKGKAKSYTVSWAAAPKADKKVKYRIEVSHSKKNKHFKAVTSYKATMSANIMSKVIKKAKIKSSRKYYFRVVSGKKVSGVWCSTSSKMKKG